MKESRVKAHTISFLLPLILFLLLSPALLFGERIKVGEPLLSGDSNEEKTRFLNILQEATLLAGGLYANYFDIAWKDSSDKADFILEVAGLLQGKDTAVSLVMERSADGAKSDSFPLIGEIDRARARFIANIIFYLWASFKEYSVERSGAPPVLIDEISGDALSQSVMASFNLMLMPTSVAVKTGGNLVAGFSSVCLEMDRYFRIVDQPGKQLLDSGNYLYAYGVAVTPGDTIILKPSMGREVYRLSPGMTEPQRWRTGVEVQGPFAVLADGSMVIVDQVNRRATRLEGKKR
ncbi:MAG TPA: hypothetical protein VMX75_07125, partial [Spirochaetia bacterium]|nr:hypothetical protein [Spirochaetia bacterium]